MMGIRPTGCSGKNNRVLSVACWEVMSATLRQDPLATRLAARPADDLACVYRGHRRAAVRGWADSAGGSGV